MSEALRNFAWHIGSTKPAAAYVPAGSHVGLVAVAPRRALAHWRILQTWIDRTAQQRGGAWHNCRMVLRLYDVTCIQFNGFNAHRTLDIPLPAICGQQFATLPSPGTTQLAEVGFVLRGGEFIPAARSEFVQFPPGVVSSHGGYTALLVDRKLRTETVATRWDQAQDLNCSRRVRLRKPLRIASFAFEAAACGQRNTLGTYVSELAAGVASLGHDVHVFLPKREELAAPREIAGVRYEPLDVALNGSPLDIAVSYARAAQDRLSELPSFDLFHLHEWMTALAPWNGTRATVLSLTSLEKTRRNGTEPGPLSLEIQKMEREIAPLAGCILTPDWLREKTLSEFGLDGTQVHPFPMEGRMPNEWEAPLDTGRVKAEIGLDPCCRLVLFVGPLEYAAGVDLLVEALPVVLRRVPALRLGVIGAGSLYDPLLRRAHALSVAHAVRLFGHLGGSVVTRLVRAAEALALPARGRVACDEDVVGLARKAGHPVIITHSGPAHLVRHEQTGLVTYDNPGSMVWALDRLLGDPTHAEQMGRNGRRTDVGGGTWRDIAAHFLELCAACFPELSTTAP